MDERQQFQDAVAAHLDQASAARVYDYLLGGAHNFAVDRTLAQQLIGRVPGAPRAAQINRAFLRRVVLHLLEHGVRQFLDLGSGIPTVGNVHEISHEHTPGTTVVYVDNDAVATAHSEQLLRDVPTVAAVQADLRHVDTVLSHPTVRALLDFDQPVAILMCAVLHFVPDTDDPAGIVSRYIDALCPGSYVALSHATADHDPNEVAEGMRLYEDDGIPTTARSHPAIARLFTGLQLIEPGVVFTSQWRPEDTEPEDPRQSLSYAGLGVLRPPATTIAGPPAEIEHPFGARSESERMPGTPPASSPACPRSVRHLLSHCLAAAEHLALAERRFTERAPLPQFDTATAAMTLHDVRARGVR